MTGRRDFLAAIGAAGLPSRARASTPPAPRVEATRTVFHAHPNAERVLVRFRAVDLDAPAGRLRVFGGRGQLLGTAGIIRRGNDLYGESWLLERDLTRITTELEAPGLARPLRSQHHLVPTPHWTIHWITVADPFELDQALRGLSGPPLAARLAVLERSRVMVNPLAVDVAWASVDHLPALRSSLGARGVERRWNVPASPVAIVDRNLFELSAAPLVLQGNGVSFALVPGAATGAPFQIVASRDGSRVALAETAGGGDPRSLGFGAHRDAMAAAVERWLQTAPTRPAPDLMPDTAIALSTTVESDRATMLTRVEEWNARFAFPRIVLGGVRELITRTTSLPSVRSLPGRGVSSRTPTARAIRESTAQRRAALVTRVDTLMDPLRHLVRGTDPGRAGWLARASFPFPGHVVFNTSPFPRSDLVRLPDGSEMFATNVPAVGYAYTPTVEDPVAGTGVETDASSLSGNRFDVRINPTDGAIVSLFDRETRREWCDAEHGGLNYVADARTEGLTRTVLPGGAERLSFGRRSPFGVIHSSVTVHADNTWVDIVNRTESERVPVDYRFAFAGPHDSVSWETPAGFERDRGPLGPRAHLRWIAVEGPDGRGLIRGLDAPYFYTDRVGDLERLVSMTTGGIARYRIDVAGPYATDDVAWRFGWDAEPLVAEAVAPGGAVPVPSFGRVLRADPLTVVLGIKMADEGYAVVAYLQNPLPFARTIEVTGALVRFTAAHRVDFVERDVGEPLTVDGETIRLNVAAFGIVAVRVSGISAASP